MKKSLFLLILGVALLSVSTANAQNKVAVPVDISFENKNFGIAPCIAYQILNANGVQVDEFPGMCFISGLIDIPLATHRLVNTANYILKIDYEAFPVGIITPGAAARGTVYKIFTPQQGRNVKIILDTNLEIKVMQYTYLSQPID